jgi:TPP-dependent pyruvate/acetoin dehydrogenase alpha subunit
MPKVDIDTADGREAALRKMLLVREFEDRVIDLFADNEIPGFVHLSQGQEATAVGSNFALEDGDYVTGTHRAHGHSLASGLDADLLLAELYGKKDGYCDGRGGSMHVANPQTGMLGAQPIVGASVPLATGAAITSQVQDEDFVAMGVTGDGAVAAGQVHEAFNLAATWQLPIVFLIENNLYSEGMVFDEQHNIDDLADMAASYGVPGEIVDGQDVEAVYETVREARERAAAGDGPTLIEAKTYRYRGHFEGDQEPYRTEEEKEEWRNERDPIENFRETLMERGELDGERFQALQAEVREEMDEAVSFARDSLEPGAYEAYDEVFAEPAPEIETFREQLQADGGTQGGDR